MKTTRHLFFYALSIAYFLYFSNQTHADYQFSNAPIDVVIPSVDKDLATLELAIKGIKENCKDVRRVIVISRKKLTNNAEWFNEENFPFSMDDIAYYLAKESRTLSQRYLTEKNSRVGWYLQQLLKFYAPFVIPDLSDNVLCLDSDTIFLNPVAFTNADHAGLYNPGSEYHSPYFAHIDKLTAGSVKKLYPEYSGISHHMLLQKVVLTDLIQMIENIHKQDFWKIFCSLVEQHRVRKSGASEYELYFNFVLSRSSKVEIRKLKWQNILSLKKLKKYKKLGYHYVSCHSYYRV